MRSIPGFLGGGLVVIALITPGASVPADIVDGKLPLIGSGGGNPFTRRCPQGHVLTGFRYRTGAVVDGIGIKCRVITSGGNLGAEADVGSMAGGNGGHAGSASCYQGNVGNPNVIAEQYGGSAAFGIADLGFVCKEWFAASRTWGAGTKWGIRIRAGTVFTAADTCFTGDSPAIGIYGRHGAIVDAVGLICGRP